jgi:hypothetical protein
MAKKAAPKSEPKKPATRAKRGKVEQVNALDPSPEILTQVIDPSPDQIRERAYQIFRAGENPSDPVADWFQAEQELSGDARI